MIHAKSDPLGVLYCYALNCGSNYLFNVLIIMEMIKLKKRSLYGHKRLFYGRFCRCMLGLFLCQVSVAAMAQSDTTKKAQHGITINGTVIDDDGLAVPGASVKIKHSTVGAITDSRGQFELKGAETDSITVESVGYQSVSQSLAFAAINSIVMPKQDNALADAVVVGYGSQKRANLTGAVETIDMEQIEDIPASNMSAFLRYSDKLAGVQIMGGESRPGQAGSITVRNPPDGGKNGGSNGPLYVIDDVVRTENDFNLLDPSVVESISIIKDGTAAIYGARAAQGVILVKTKAGKRGPASVGYSSSYGFSDAAAFPEMMSGYDLATYYNDELISRGRDSTDAGFYASDELDYFKNHRYKWLDMAWKSSFTTRQSLTVSGGSDNATYFAGASYYYGDGNLDGIDYRKWNFQASSNFRIANHLSLGLGVNGTVANKKWFFLKQGGENPEKDVMNLLRTPEFIPPYIRGLAVQPPGNLNRDEGLHFFQAQGLNNYTLTRQAIINVNANLKYEFPFLKGLNANVVFNKNYNNGWGKQYGTFYKTYTFSMLGSHKHIYGGDVINEVLLNNGDRVRISPDYTEAYQFNMNLNYDRTFGKHHVSAVVLMEQAESYYETVAAEKDGVADVGVDYMNAAFGAMTTTNAASETGTLSYAGRVNYTYNDKYIGEFAWRYDASTNFGPDYRWGFFPSVSGAWIISNEDFLKNSKIVNFLKLRGSMGLMGRDRTAAWSWFQGYNYQPGGHGAVFGGNSDRTSAVQLGNLPNPAVHWDNINNFNLGIDAITLDSHLDVNLDAYYSHGFNLLSTLSGSVPLTVGSTMPAENYAVVNSLGLELTVSYSGKIGEDFKYTVTTGAGYTNSKNVKVDVAQGDIGTWKDLTGTWSRNRGQQGYVYEGMFRSREDVEAFMAEHPGYTIMGEIPQPGMLYYKDLRGPIQEDGTYGPPDGKITEEDQMWLKPHRGTGFGNLSFVFKWKSLQAHIKTNFQLGSKDYVPSQGREHVKAGVSGPAIWVDHWTQANIDAKYPATYYDATYRLLSDFWLENSSSFGVSLIDLSYNLSPSLVKSMGLKSARLYLTVTNPIDLHNKIFDYNLNYPTLKTAVLGLSVNL